MKISPLKSLMMACLLGVATLPVAYAKNNPPPTIKADAPNRYTVKKGDTLWGISGKYLNAPHRWREIWATNKQLKNPHLIYPGDVLILCIIKGKTLVGVDTGEGCAGIEKAMQAPAKGTPIQVNTSSESISIIPLANIRHWLSRAEIVNPLDLGATPRVIAAKQGKLLTAVGDKIYVRGTVLNLGETYGVYRQAEPYVDTQTGQVVGAEVIQVARGLVTDVAANGVSSLKITHTYEAEIKEGDRVFSEISSALPSAFHPVPAEVTRGGMIVRVMGGVDQQALSIPTSPNRSVVRSGTTVGGRDGVVAINLGATQGARAGHVLDVYRKGALIKDVHGNNDVVRLPSEKIGQVMVFKVFNKISYAYVLDAEYPLSMGDLLLPPSDL
ncbi:MAG: LysM peptidoglycan-binding domain-containing protein [Moraxella sp.]|nr:LysM peptidoglycan-binding domain-containing protein [Moraxella sp.]